MDIKDIQARAILDSRGNPTVEADVWLASGVMGRASVPSGASTGVHEAHELRDGGTAFGGKGVLKAVANIHEKIRPLLTGMASDDQFLLDQKMIDLDGTTNKSSLGANAILAVSLAAARAAANQRGIAFYKHINDIAGGPAMSLPMPMMNILNGGKHAEGSTDIQETMIIPIGARSYAQAVQIGSEVFAQLKNLLHKKGYTTTVGDEGGFAPSVKHGNSEALELIKEAVIAAGYDKGATVAVALDVASSELYNKNHYVFTSENKVYSTHELIQWYQQLLKKFPIVSIEDGLAEDDWEGWQQLTEQLGNKSQLVGDDLLVTNTKRLQRAIDLDAANAILIKPNQIGTLTETIRAVELAKKHGWGTIISHRSGETEDVSIAHIAVGTGAGQIKTGSLSRSERTAKHNELMRIEELDSSLKLANPYTK